MCCVCAKSLQSYPTLCDPMDFSPPSSSVHGILQEEYWSGLPCSPSGNLLKLGIKLASLTSPISACRVFTTSTTCEALPQSYCMKFYYSTYSISTLLLYSLHNSTIWNASLLFLLFFLTLLSSLLLIFFLPSFLCLHLTLIHSL